MTIYHDTYTGTVDAIILAYLRQRKDDPAAHDRWQADLDEISKDYTGHLKTWAALPARKPYPDAKPDRLTAARLAADDLDLGEFTILCKFCEGDAGLYPAMRAAAAVEGRDGWADVFNTYCHSVKQRQAAFTKFTKLAQAVLDADPATPPAVDIGGAGRGWLDKQAIVLPYSTKWEAARAAAVDIMGRTNGFAL